MDSKAKKKESEKDRSRSRRRSRRSDSGSRRRDKSPGRERQRDKSGDKGDKKKKEKKDKDKDKKDKEKKEKPTEELVEVMDQSVPPPEPVAPPRKEQSKGGSKGSRKGKQKCKFCGTQLAGHQSAMDQHQWLNLWCLQHQMWQKMSADAKAQPESWAKAKHAAFAVKESRQKLHAQDGVDVVALDPESERAPSPARTVRSQLSAGSLRVGQTPASSSRPPVLEGRASVSPSPVKQQEKKKEEEAEFLDFLLSRQEVQGPSWHHHQH